MVTKLGLYYIKFLKDNTIFRIRIPDALVRGITMGDRLFSYENKCLYMDTTNRICSYNEMNPPENELEDAYKKKLISKKDYEMAYRVGNKILKNASKYVNKWNVKYT